MAALRDVVIVVLLAAAGAASMRADAAQRQATLQVSATIVDPAQARSIQHVRSVLVTPQDIARGFVEVPYGSRIALSAAAQCVIEISATGSFFRSVTVRSVHGTGRIEANGPALRQRACAGAASSVDLSFRFELAPHVEAGLYRWPVLASVLPF